MTSKIFQANTKTASIAIKATGAGGSMIGSPERWLWRLPIGAVSPVTKLLTLVAGMVSSTTIMAASIIGP